MKRNLTMLFFCVSVLLLSSCSRVAVSNNLASAEISAVESNFTETESKESGQWENLKTEARKSLEEDEYLFLVGFSSDASNTASCRLIAKDGSFDETITLAYLEQDIQFHYAIFEENSLEIDLAPELKTVKLTVEKTNYLLDFKAGTYSLEINYRIKDLKPEYLVDKSPDGKLSLYKTYILHYGDSVAGDYVILDEETQEIMYLGLYGGNSDQAVFCGQSAVLINRAEYLELLDARTGEPLPNIPQFDYGEENNPQYYTLGIANDFEQGKTLIAYRDNDFDGAQDWESKHEVYVAVFDMGGNRIDTIDTGFMIYPIYRVFLTHINFESVENGTAVLSTLESNSAYDPIEKVELGSIHY